MGSIYTDRSEYALSTWTLDGLGLRDALGAIRDAGFSDVEIWADNVHLDPRLDPDVPQAKRWLREFGQSLHSIHAPFRGFTPRPASDEDFLRWRMDLWHKTIDYCAELSCPIMVVHALNTREYRYTVSQAHVVRDSLAEL
ncbi:MAG TPA: TIM barrel protein, partial [Candidatus Limnocylindria bacterium]|nr:TIM barrel protein [Candidatus Limnocylindria bacterium]